jgi:hypothetical protein
VIIVGISWVPYRKLFWVFVKPKIPPYMTALSMNYNIYNILRIVMFITKDLVMFEVKTLFKKSKTKVNNILNDIIMIDHELSSKALPILSFFLSFQSSVK